MGDLVLYDENRPPAHQDPMIAFTLNMINKDFGEKCTVNRKTLNKFGGNPDVGITRAPINSWGEFETYQSSNVALVMSSSNAGDTASITIEAMVLTGGVFVFTTIMATLDGQNQVTLPTAAVRWMRMYTTDEVGVTGDVYIYRSGAATAGVPDDLTTVHNSIPAGANQSQKAATSIANSNYFLLTDYWADVVRKIDTSISVEFRIRDLGGSFRTFPRRGAGTGNRLEYNYRPPLIIQPNSDIEMVAQSTAAATDVTGGFDGIFADIPSQP